MINSDLLTPDKETAALPTAQLLAHLSSESPYLRSRVLAGLGARLHETPEVFEQVLRAIQAPENRRAPFFGFITVSWIGAIAVLNGGAPEQVKQVSTVLRGWDETEKEDLRYHLRNSGLELQF